MGERFVAVGLMSLMVACGGRSNLGLVGEVEESRGAEPGAGGEAGASSSATTTGGAGGSPPALSCPSLSVGWGPLFVAWPEPGIEVRAPRLASLGGAVALTVAAVPSTSGGNGAVVIAHTRIEPWGEGAPALPPLQLVAAPSNRRFFTAPSSALDRYALYYQQGGPGGPMVVVPALDPSATYTPNPPGIGLPLAAAQPSAFLAWPSGGHLVLFRTATSPQTTAVGAGVVDGGLGPFQTSTSGCGASRPIEAAALDDETAIVAWLSNSEAGSCPQPPPPNSPGRLQTGTIARSTAATTLEEDRVLLSPSIIRLTGRSDGAWVLIDRAEGGEVNPSVNLQRLDARGAFVGPEVQLIPAGDGSLDHEQVRWGNGFALVADDPNTNVEPTVGLWLADPDGALVATTRLEAPALPARPKAIVVGPDQDSFLVAFSSFDPNGTVGLLRFDCEASR